jgi:uncharacterized protein (TIGR03437 family)
MTVPVTLTVVGAGVPFFGGVAGGLSFVSGSGFSPAPQNVQINNAGTGALNWTAAVSTVRSSTVSNVNWLSTSAASGIAPATVTVSVSPQGLPPGIYLGQVLFQAASSSVTIPVSVVVVDSNTSTFEQVPGVNFTMPVGSNPLGQTVTLVNTGASFFFTPTVQTAGGGAWLQVDSACGNRSTPAACLIKVNATTLSAGVYAGQVIFSNGSTAVTVPVTLTVVGAGAPFFGGVAGGLSFVSGSGFSPAPQNVQLNNAGSGALSWTAAVSTYRTSTAGNVNWLSTSATSGNAPSIVTVGVSPQGLPPGIYLGQVLFQAASSSVTIPVSLVVVDSNTTSTFEQVPGVNFTMPVGSNPLAQTVTLVNTGASFFFTPTVQTAGGGAWLQVDSACGNRSTPAACSISVNATTLSAGVYAGQVTFSSGSTAVTVPVTLTVVGAGAPFFGGVAGGLSFVSGSGFSPAPQNVQLNNAGTGVLNWTAVVSMFRTSTVVVAGQFTDVNWLSTSATSGSAPSIVTVSVSPQGLPPGIYLGQVLFLAASSSVTIPVSLVVVDSNTSTFEQVPGVNFTMPVGSNPLAQTVTLVNTGASFFFTPTIQTAGGGAWLQVDSACGNRSTPAACVIKVNATTLAAGVYAGQITFSNGSTAVTVPVTLTVVGAGAPFFGGIAGGLSFVSGSGFSPAPRSVQLNNAGSGALNWTAAVSMYRTTTVVIAGQFSDVNWLSASATNGIAPSIVTVSVSPQGLPAGIYLGQILFQAASGSVTIPVSLVVADSDNFTFQQVPAVNFATPVGSNPLAQTVTLASTGAGFFFTPTAQTAGGGAWLQVDSACGNRSTPAACSISVNATTLSAGIYAGQVVFNNGSTAMTVPVSLTVGNPASSAPSITSGGIVPVGSSAGTIQPGEWVSIYGRNLASGTATWNGDFPTSLGGTSVTINGKKAYLWYVSPGQINLQSPDDATRGSVPVVVTTANGSSTSTVILGDAAPSFLLLDSKHVTGIIFRSNGSGAFGGGSYDIIGPTGASLGYPTVAAKAGDIIGLYAVGLGPTNPPVAPGQGFSGAAPTINPVTLLINGRSVTPSFAGLSGAGLYQINLTVPSGLGTGDVALQASVGGAQTPTGTVISLQ